MVGGGAGGLGRGGGLFEKAALVEGAGRADVGAKGRDFVEMLALLVASLRDYNYGNWGTITPGLCVNTQTIPS